MTEMLQREFPRLLAEWGYAAIVVAIIADSFGLPVPGELMLLLASVYTGATHRLLLPLVIVAAAAGAIVGDNAMYVVARRGGRRLLQRYGERLHLGYRRQAIGQYLFRRYGGHAVLMGRLIPVLHIWTSLFAGVSRMPWGRFALANAAGAVTWATGLSVAGYVLGRDVLDYGGIIAALGLPLAVMIAGSTILVLRMNERRLYERATESDAANEGRTSTG
jgi:membrane protein DedA with SNARE-associated domain